MKHFSPLRYPGGKTFLASEFGRILELINLDRPTYVEPYAGGAGAALALLFANKVEQIVINDLDENIYAFWKSVTEQNKKFVRKILSTPVTIAEWKKQKQIYLNKNAGTFEKGFATFFLNRTNRSGVLNAGPIGGMKQNGSYKLDARYNKDDLMQRIIKIGEYKDHIKVLNEEGILLTKKYLQKKNTFIYLDPPYMKQGSMLYLDQYEASDHVKLADLLNNNANSRWILTYEEMDIVRSLYQNRERKRLDFRYRVHNSLKPRKARELMIFSNPVAVAFA